MVLYCFREGGTHDIGSVAVFTGGKVENVNCNNIVTIIVCPLTVASVCLLVHALKLVVFISTVH